MNFRKTIIGLWTDDDANYKIGLENGITPEKVLSEMGIKWNGDRRDYKYQQARVELNVVCSILCKEGYKAGGIGRCPTTYIIAKNPTEQRLMLTNSAQNNIGRVVNYMRRGDGLIVKKLSEKLIRELLEFIPGEEKEDDEQMQLVKDA